MKQRLFWCLTLLRDILVVPFVALLPRNEKKIVCGAWSGKQFSCNPKYLAIYLAEQRGYNIFWVGEEYLKDDVEKRGIRFLRKGSLLAFLHCITAKFYVCNINWCSDILNFPTCRRVTVVNVWHGIPNKCIGDRQKDGSGNVGGCTKKRGLVRTLLYKALVKFDDYCYSQESWHGAASPFMDKVMVASFPNRFKVDKILKTGQPRTDFLINNRNNGILKAELKSRMAKILGVDPTKKWYLYLPTWRHDAANAFSFVKSSHIEKYRTILKAQDAILIEKQHPKMIELLELDSVKGDVVSIVSAEMSKRIDTQELLLCSDRLISDYSSCVYDFAHLKRPVINFTYDYDFYANQDSGLECDIRECAAGPFAYDEEELKKLLALDDDTLLADRKNGCDEHMSYETGVACESIFARVIKNQ